MPATQARAQSLSPIMEERSSRKRRAQDYHWRGKMPTEQEKQKKKKMEEQRTQGDASAGPSASTDGAALKPRRNEKEPTICGEEGEARSNDVSVRMEQVFEARKKAKSLLHSPCKLKEHNQAQEDRSIGGDELYDRAKRELKKVRFSDEVGSRKCEQKESLANDCAGQASFTASCSCNEDNSEAVPPQDEPLKSNAGQIRSSLDAKSLSTRIKQKDEDDEVWGKRFMPEEDELLKNAVLEYIKVKGWEEKEGIGKVLNCRKHKEAHNCWGVIRRHLQDFSV